MIAVFHSRMAKGFLTCWKACMIASALVLTLVATSANAQSIFAALSGTVADPSGAVISNARVEIQNVESKVVRVFVTDKSGYFSVSQLPIGTYNVTVTADGFQQWVGSGIVLHGMENKSLNIPLKVGSTNATVEVSASEGEINITDSGAKASVITSEQLQHLTMIGRNATEILRIIPGAAQVSLGGSNQPSSDGSMIGINGFTVNGNAGGMSAVSINGQSGQGLSINQDGQNVEDPGAPGAATPVNPNPDMISEVSVLTSNYGADNAKGPVVINSLSKSGGSAFHGDFHSYFRNSALNAEQAYAKLQESEAGYNKGYLKVPSHNYDPGFDIGGPILIPGTSFNKERKKFFFHESFESYLQLFDGGINTAFVPTANMISTGDFSPMGTAAYAASSKLGFGAISAVPTTPSQVGPAFRSGCSINGGVMNKACIDPAAQLWLQNSLPTPTLSSPNPLGYNYVSPVQETQNDYHNMAKVDVNLSDKTKMYVTWSHQQENANMTLGLWQGSGNGVIPSPSPTIGANSSDLYTFNFVRILSPTVTVEARVGYTHEYMPGKPGAPNKVLRKDMNFPLTGVFSNPNAPVATSWGGSIPNIGDIGHDYHPTFYAEKGIPSTGADLTKVMKTHTIKVGYLWEKIYNAQDAWAQYQGVFSYGPWNTFFTGNNYADILMGANEGYFEQALPPAMQMEQKATSFYATDHWKLNRHITLDYGLRLEHFGAPYANNQWGLAAFTPSAYQSSGTNPGVSWHSLNSSTPISGNTESFLVYSPRVGAAIDLFGNGKTVLRGGWGAYRYGVNLQTYQGAANTAVGSLGWSAPGSAISWENIDQFKNGGGGSTASCAANVSGGIDAGNNHCAPTVTWGVPTDFSNSTIYVADVRNHDQPYTVTYSLNIDQQLPAKFLGEVSYVGNHSDLTQSSINMNSVPIGAMTAASVTQTCQGLDTNSDPATQLNNQLNDSYCQQRFRPFPKYQAVNAPESSAIAQYDSFQSSLTRSAGFATLSFNYAFSKNLANSNQSGAMKDYGRSEYWTLANFNRAQVFNASYIFTLPKFNIEHRLLSGLANGWELSGITQIQSGAMLTANTGYQFSMSNAAAAQFLAGTPDVTVAPILTCDPKTGLKKGQFANPSCFKVPTNTSGTIGNGRFPYLAGPKYWNSDIAIHKAFSITEQQKLDVRFSAFDFMNHALPSFVAGGDNNLKLQFDSSGKLTNATDTTHACPGALCQAFGYADVHYGQRRLEVSAKYSF